MLHFVVIVKKKKRTKNLIFGLDFKFLVHINNTNNYQARTKKEGI